VNCRYRRSCDHIRDVDVSQYMFPGGSFESFVTEVVAAERRGYAGAWLPQIFGWDVLTALALVGRETSTLRLGTAVVPTHPTHPLVLAQAALTTQAASGGRLHLGVGVSHAFLVEGVWGYSYDRPAAWLREYLDALLPALRGERPDVAGERVTARPPRPLDLPGAEAPPVYAAALAPAMLRLAGRRCAGTITWLTGPRTLERHVVPAIRVAAEEAGRPAPRVVAGLPVCVTRDARRARERAAEQLAVYSGVPSYRAMLDREGVASPADLALVGGPAEITDRLGELAAIGVDEFMAYVYGDPDEREATHGCLRAGPVAS
jgi:5,10-methylenetetrahydromethanopterin reductase